MGDTEILTFRAGGDLRRILFDTSEKTGLSFSEIVRKSIPYYLVREGEGEIARQAKIVQQRMKREDARQENRDYLTGITLALNQGKLLSRLKREGISKGKLMELSRRLQHEATLYGVDSDISGVLTGALTRERLKGSASSSRRVQHANTKRAR
jgi:hypothetical protein